MTYKITPGSGLVCSALVFEINGIEADEEDFGSGWDEDPDSASPYGCGDRIFKALEKPKPETLKKYSITEEEWRKIASELEDELSVGSCSMCE